MDIFLSDISMTTPDCDPVIDVTFVTLLRLTQDLNDNGGLLAQAGHELAFASLG